MTFGEWQASQESLGRATQYVLERDGRVRGWLRVAGDGDVGRFDLLAEPDALDDLVRRGDGEGRESRLDLHAGARASIRSDAAASSTLGFEAGDEYMVLSRRTVMPVKDKAKVPAVVQTTFG